MREDFLKINQKYIRKNKEYIFLKQPATPCHDTQELIKITENQNQKLP